MSASAKHANGTEDSDRPTKRLRVDDDEEVEDGTVGNHASESQKASDLYLDTVRIASSWHVLAFPLMWRLDKQSRVGL